MKLHVNKKRDNATKKCAERIIIIFATLLKVLKSKKKKFY